MIRNEVFVPGSEAPALVAAMNRPDYYNNFAEEIADRVTDLENGLRDGIFESESVVAVEAYIDVLNSALEIHLGL